MNYRIALRRSGRHPLSEDVIDTAENARRVVLRLTTAEVLVLNGTEVSTPAPATGVARRVMNSGTGACFRIGVVVDTDMHETTG
jgi:hypothetical protein